LADPSITIPGVILAGGEARRLPDKPFRHLGGVTLIERVIARAKPQVTRLAVSIRGVGARYRQFGVDLVPDDLAESLGPLAGIAAGLRYARGLDADRVAFFPSDAPFLPPDLVERLAAAITPSGVAIPTYAGRTHPAFGLWRTRLEPDLSAALDAGERRLHTVVGMFGAALVPFDDLADDPFLNVNSEADLAAAEHRLARTS
jgi:molybdopterin-guanine dinucleotide biosynthesis protein A